MGVIANLGGGGVRALGDITELCILATRMKALHSLRAGWRHIVSLGDADGVNSAGDVQAFIVKGPPKL